VYCHGNRNCAADRAALPSPQSGSARRLLRTRALALRCSCLLQSCAHAARARQERANGSRGQYAHAPRCSPSAAGWLSLLSSFELDCAVVELRRPYDHMALDGNPAIIARLCSAASRESRSTPHVLHSCSARWHPPSPVLCAAATTTQIPAAIPGLLPVHTRAAAVRVLARAALRRIVRPLLCDVQRCCAADGCSRRRCWPRGLGAADCRSACFTLRAAST
jgi:hypothetical protein